MKFLHLFSKQFNKFYSVLYISRFYISCVNYVASDIFYDTFAIQHLFISKSFIALILI